MDEPPRVFETSAVTLTAGPGGFRVYAGPNELSLFEKAEVVVENGKPPYVRLTYPRERDLNRKLRVEEEVRLLRVLGWVQVG